MGSFFLSSPKIVQGKHEASFADADGKAIAQASIKISQETVDPILIETISNLKHSGIICDLGCGCATTLARVCKATGNKGIGFEIQECLVRETEDISVELGNITALEGTWGDVSIVTQKYVFHDFVLDHGADILRSYFSSFPNLEYFIYVDIVSPEKPGDTILPGFDYVHSLLGIPTPTYKQTVAMFEEAGYDVLQEIPVEQLPNNFVWILTPKKR